ncbi:DHS-like NAD/FAD-binding domain-containing protein [Podospora aff. communis PSN243]|uniref:DHS-like NAD/FAD-binding domain-containing protein n=1 Tax=Podospora aff. communis PSN243 TaxID=3040156 RepID=A0AAV9GGW2_9PEZI|nr:DHS-like NAD/FAD-binding domain-containing protein [Podospora aff. communis PSN243]
MSLQTSTLDPAKVASFKSHLSKSSRIVTVIGAGLSASSGLPTFRDVNGLWHSHDVFLIASPAGFRRDPGLVWQFYSERRRNARRVSPNPAHYALVNLAKAKPGFVALSQNVDGLLQRADMPPAQLKLLHGNLFDLSCAGNCGYVDYNNFVDPLCEVLAEGRARSNVMGTDVDEDGKPPKASAMLFEGIAAKNKKILGEEKFDEAGPTARDAAPLRELGEEVRVPETAPELHSGIEKGDLPQCPGCGKNLLRPRVVWFGEALPEDVMEDVDALFKEKIDLCIVVGTSSKVWPAAGFCEEARAAGAKVAWVNKSAEDCRNAKKEDWVFLGDAAAVLPEILGTAEE